MYLPRRLWLSRILKNSATIDTRDRRVIVILSTDTEFDPPSGDGSWWTRSSTTGLLDGLQRFLEICVRYGTPATFFCEGKLVEELPNLFRDLARSHEIGCHSYNHEWLGTRPPPKWIPHWENLAILSTAEKAKVLRRAVNSITKVIGNEPRSFKAPFNSIDHPSTLSMLERTGFNSDSSLPSYDMESFVRPIHPAPPHHPSSRSLWQEGNMALLEVPYSIRPHPRLFHPLQTPEETLDTVRRAVELALEDFELKCKLDSLSGRELSLLHVTSHPRDFSDTGRWRGDGTANVEGLVKYLDELMARYDVKFLTVTKFLRTWENEYCTFHSTQRPH